MKSGLKLWSKRFSVAKGLHWQYERDVNQSNQQDWMRIFKQDEPDVYFLVSSANIKNKTPAK